MHSVHNLLFSNDLHPSTKLILPPLNGKHFNHPQEKSPLSRDIIHSTLTPPAFLEPQPQTTLDTIRHSRPHRLSLSSLSSIASTSSLSTSDSFQDQDYFSSSSSSSPIIQQQRYRNILPLPHLHTSIQQNNNNNDNDNNNDHSFNQDHRKLSSSSSVSIKSSLLPLTTKNHKQENNNNSNNNHSSPITSPSPPSSSLLTFWASPSPTTIEQQHEFVTKNSHIKRPRNAWIHFRCYFGQSLKAKDPTIRAEEISKRASEYWARLTSKQKKPWHIMAEQEKLAHQEAFPDYRYRPKRALPKSVVLTYQSNNDQDSDSCKKFRLK
ncbi:unnamed protein product [Cunninghamella blakesleeana]